jgi:hypothetical protein
MCSAGALKYPQRQSVPDVSLDIRYSGLPWYVQFVQRPPALARRALLQNMVPIVVYRFDACQSFLCIDDTDNKVLIRLAVVHLYFL